MKKFSSETPGGQQTRQSDRVKVYRKIRDLVFTLRKLGAVVLLDSQSPDHPASGPIYLAGMPQKIMSFRGEVVTREPGSDSAPKALEAPWEILRDFRANTGGTILGYLGYDLKNYSENLVSSQPDAVMAPDLWFMEPGILLEIDRETGDVNYLAGSESQLKIKPAPANRKPGIGPVVSGITYRDYIDMVSEARRRINEGDFYEINLTNQFHSFFEGDTYDLFEAMRDAGPVPFAAYIAGIGAGVGNGNGKDSDSDSDYDNDNDNDKVIDICCASPERFLYKKGRRVISEPIKGTVAAGRNLEEDRKAILQLQSSAKDQAENLMIVDLVRNDLARIALQGSVKVDSLFGIQSFKTVHQMVSRISAEVDPATDPVDIIRSCYPMGSMTGAPKISAMQSIEELERYRRGIYSGAIGYIHESGDFDFNVVIRTAIVKGNDLYYSAGGAITGDSDPDLEWEESLVKIRALLQAFGNDPPPSIRTE